VCSSDLLSTTRAVHGNRKGDYVPNVIYLFNQGPFNG
jgi:hypothetical protein